MHRQTLSVERRSQQAAKYFNRRRSSSVSTKRLSANLKDQKLTKKYTNKLIDYAARDQKKGWRHMETLRGEERSLKAAIEAPRKRAPQVMSLESIRFQSSVQPEVDDDIAQGLDATIELGTFLEIRRNEQCTHGVVLGEEFLDGVVHIVTLVSTGEVWKHFKDDVMFTIPGLALPDLISRCGPEEVAASSTAVNARVQVLKRVRELEKSVETAFNILGRRSHTIYRQVKSTDPNSWSEVTVDDVVRLLTTERKPSAVTTFAVHKHLMEQHKEFVADSHAYRMTRKFAVRPESHIQDIETIVEMTRQPNGGPLDSFAQRARRIIESNRKLALESFNEPPRIDSGKGTLSKEDEVVVRFLLNSVRPKRTIQADPYIIGTSFIMKKLGVSPGTVDDDTVYRTLVDLGVLAPWQDLVSRRLDLNLDQSEEDNSSLPSEQTKLVEKFFSPKPSAQLSLSTLGPEDFYGGDLVESVRHDFGNQAVYVIDDEGAQELDDGISFEPIPSEPGLSWVHVHIADPTADLPPTHVFVRQARNQLETAYFLHRTWPMLPRSLMKTRLSLGVSSANGEPERVLSFSFKVDHSGDIVDYKVRAGLVRNVKVVMYDSFDAAIGEVVPPISRPFVSWVRPVPIPADASFVGDFKGLKEVAGRLVSARLKTDSFSYSLPSASLSLSETPSTSSQPPDFTTLPRYRGFPNLDYAVSSFADTDAGSRGIVSEMMKAAGRIASRFCLERGVPVLRRSLGKPIVSSEESLQRILNMRDLRGQVDSIETTRAGVLIPPASYTLEPGMHWAMGVPEGEGYIRVTSPLRRYSDMVWHWQIKHALLPSAAPLYFKPDQLKEFAFELSRGERISRGAQRLHKQFWALLYIQRWMNDPRNVGKPGPLEDLVAFTTTEPALNLHLKVTQCRVHIPALGLEAFIRGIDNDLPLGSVLPVRIEKISLGVRPQLEVTKRSRL